MSALLHRIVGFATTSPTHPEILARVVRRASPLSPILARLVILDYLGATRNELSESLGVELATIDTYWKRVYRKLDIASRDDLRRWVEQTLNIDHL